MKLHFHYCLAILSLIVLEVASEKTQIKSVFPNRTSPPGLKSPRKCWWAKEITPDFHVSGRLTERQIKYAAGCGFKSIVSLFTYPDNEPPSYFGGDYLPSTSEAKKVTEEIAGMKYINLLDPMDEWASVEAVFKMTKVRFQKVFCIIRYIEFFSQSFSFCLSHSMIYFIDLHTHYLIYMSIYCRHAKFSTP